MAKPYKIPDFRKMYPEASEEVIAVLRTTERKMQYQEYDLKVEQTIVDEEKQTVTVIPSREDSYERLSETAVQFVEQASGIEEQVIHQLEVKQLYEALSLLSDDERYLIEQLYFEERSERDLAKEMGVYHNAIHKQKKQILARLKKILKNF